MNKAQQLTTDAVRMVRNNHRQPLGHPKAYLGPSYDTDMNPKKSDITKRNIFNKKIFLKSSFVP